MCLPTTDRFYIFSFYIENYCVLCGKKHINNDKDIIF